MPHVTRCVHAAFGNSYDMSQRGPATDTEDVPSYEQTRREITAAFLRMAETGERPDPAQMARLEAGLREGTATGEAQQPALPPEPVVYYFRVGNRIKIGYTQSLHHRVRSLMPEEVIGWESGNVALERRRHRQFAAYRVTREWFEDCEAIRDHIATLA